MKSKLFVLGIVILLLLGCATEKSSWEKAKKENTKAAYINYMKKYPKSSFKRIAGRRLAFLRAAEKNTVEAYDKFLKLHYKSKDLADEARARIEGLYIDEAIKQNSINPYEGYLRKYPNGNRAGLKNPHLEKVYFQDIKKETSIVKLETFLKRFPRGQFSAEVIQMLEKSYFEDAESRDSVLFYNDFIKRYPSGTWVKEARAAIEEIYKRRHPSLRQAKTVKLNIDASFPVPAPPEIERAARGLMEYTGLEVAGSEAREYDAQLNIKIEGKPVEGSYTDGSTRYSGAKVSGSIAFMTNNSTLTHKKFYFRYDPPITTSGRNKYPKPEDAPFEKALDGPNSFAARLIELTAELFGRGIYKSAMRDSSDLIQLAAASILLEKWKEKKTWAIDLLKAEIHDVDKPFVTRLFNHLRRQKDKLTIDLLLSAAVNNKFEAVRLKAIGTLASMNVKRILDPLISILESDDLAVKGSAANALGRLEDPRAITPLLDALKTAKDIFLQMSIISALGQFKHPRVIKPLIDLLGAEHPFVRGDAARSLKQVTGEDFGQDQSKWQEWWSKNQKR